MTKKKAPERITVIIRDQLGSPYGIVAITKEVVLEATYVTTNGVLQLVLASTQMQGHSSLQWLDITRASKTNGQIVETPTNGLKQEKIFEIQSQHNMLNITDEDEIRKVWAFLNIDIPVDDLFKYRAESLKTLAVFKEKKRKEQEEKLKKSQEELQPLSDDDKKLIAAIKSGQIGISEKEFNENERSMRAVAKDIPADLQENPKPNELFEPSPSTGIEPDAARTAMG